LLAVGCWRVGVAIGCWLLLLLLLLWGATWGAMLLLLLWGFPAHGDDNAPAPLRLQGSTAAATTPLSQAECELAGCAQQQQCQSSTT
jgi:hypothetical protein